MRLLFCRALLLIVGGGIFVIANVPSTMASFGSTHDMVNHAVAFASLTLLVVAAFPRARSLLVFIGLMAFNTAIEFSQKALGFGRQAEVLDWLVGAAATLIVLVLLAVLKAMRRLVTG